MKKNVLLVSYNFHPEPTGIGKYNGEKIEWLVAKGHNCTVITSYPYYPYWEVQNPYRKSRFWFKKEYFPGKGERGNLIIYRCPQYVPSNPTGLKRMVLDFTFTMSAILAVLRILPKERFDAIINIAPSFQLGLLGILYKKLRGGRLLYHVQDLQIEAARDLGIIKSGFVLSMLFRIERYILMRADVISTISDGMATRIKKKAEREVALIPNWVDMGRFFPLQEKEQLKVAYGFTPQDRVVLYSGAIGEKQGLDMILSIAGEFQESRSFGNVRFVICGSGPYKKSLEKNCETSGLKNVSFFPLQPSEKFNSFLNMADIHLVIQKSGAGDLVMPSKLATILAVGGVPIVTANPGSSLYRLISDFKMGIVVSSDDKAALKHGIVSALSGQCATISANAIGYALDHLSIDSIMKEFFKTVLEQNSRMMSKKRPESQPSRAEIHKIDEICN